MSTDFDRDWALATEARKLRDEGQFDKAIELFTHLLNRYNVSELYFERGTTYSQSGDFANAVADFTQAIALKGDDPDCYVNRGNAYLKQEQFATAIEDYDRALQLSPHLACAHNSRAYAYQRIERIDRAIDGFLHAIDLDRSYASPYFNLGRLFFEIGRLNDALTYLNTANELLPNDAAVLSALGDVRSALEKG
jgi:tetratricopeptide (TPR) repeat protein